MRADICEAGDSTSFAKFKEAVSALGGKPDGKSWALGVSIYRVKFGKEELTVFIDGWSVDIEGSEALVSKVMAAYRNQVSGA